MIAGMASRTVDPSPTRTGLGVLGQPPVAAGVALVLFLGTLVALSVGPSWRLEPLKLGTPGENLQAVSWSPDGTRFTVQRTDQFLVVRASDGRVLRTVAGRWPVWVDDSTIDALRDIGLQRTELVRVDLQTGIWTTIAQPLPAARLAGGGVSPLAATSVIGPRGTVVLDPVDGRRIAVLPELRGIAWARPGFLIAKTVVPDLQASGSLPGLLRVWTAVGGVQSIGVGLVELRDAMVPSPSGDAFACVCARLDAASMLSAPALYKVPIDGSAPTRLSDWVDGGPTANPLVAWLDDSSIVFLDGAGMHRINIGPGPMPMPRLDPGTLFTPGNAGRLYRIGDGLAILESQGGGPTGVSWLTLLGPNADVRFRRFFPSWNTAILIVDPLRPRAVLATDPQPPDGPPDRFFVLSYE